MTTVKVAITVDSYLLAQVDALVADRVYPNRSKAFQAALQEVVAKKRRSRLARECAKLEPQQEQNLAEVGLEQELAAWPEY